MAVLFKAPADGEVKELPVVKREGHGFRFDGEEGLVFGEISRKVVLHVGHKNHGVFLPFGEKGGVELVPVKGLEPVPVGIVGKSVISVNVMSESFKGKLHSVLILS